MASFENLHTFPTRPFAVRISLRYPGRGNARYGALLIELLEQSRASNQERAIKSEQSRTDGAFGRPYSERTGLTTIGETFAALSTALAPLFADETTTESGKTAKRVRYMYEHSKR